MPKAKTNNLPNGLLKAKVNFQSPKLWVVLGLLVVVGGYVAFKTFAAFNPYYFLCAPPNQPTIQQGSTGNCVKYLQLVLIYDAGQKIQLDGNFGPATKQAVMNLQKLTGLNPVDGIVGPNTWAVVNWINASNNGPGTWNYGPVGESVAWDAAGQQTHWNVSACKAQPFGYMMGIKAVRTSGPIFGTYMTVLKSSNGPAIGLSPISTDSTIYVTTTQQSASFNPWVTVSGANGGGGTTAIPFWDNMPNC